MTAAGNDKPAGDECPPPRSAAGNRSPWLIAVVVSIATFMQVLDTSIANVALRNIAGSLAAGIDESTWVITTYLIASSVIVPPLPPPPELELFLLLPPHAASNSAAIPRKATSRKGRNWRSWRSMPRWWKEL